MRKVIIFCLVMVCMNMHAMNVHLMNVGNTPLHCAAAKGHVEAVKKLIDPKAYKQMKGWMPWCYALLSEEVDSNHVENVKVRTNIINAVNYYRQTPLHLAAYYNHTGVLKELLAQEEIYVNAVDCNGGTPLHYAAEKGCFNAVDTLVAAGANVDAVNQLGMKPFYYKVCFGYSFFVEAHTEIMSNDGCALTQAAKSIDMKSSIDKHALDVRGKPKIKVD